MLKYLKWFFSLMVFYAEEPNGGGADSGAAGGADAGAAGGDAGKGGDAGAAGGDGKPGGGAEGKAADAAANQNWRDRMAGGDPKKVERLSRYGAETAVADALLSVQERISKGELRSNVPFPDKGTDAEKETWRKEQGLPTKADDYIPQLKLAEGREIKAEDKARIDGFLGRVHAVNASPAVASELVNIYYDEIEARTNERLELDKTQVQTTRDELIASQGLPEFKTNLNLVNAMVDMVPQEVRDLFKGARLADGSPLIGGNSKVFMGLVEMARAINPAAALVPGSGDNSMATIDAEIEKNLKAMRTDRKAWDANPKNQERHLALLDAQARAGGKKS